MEEEKRESREGQTLAVRLLLWTGERRLRRGTRQPAGERGVLLWVKLDSSTIAPWGYKHQGLQILVPGQGGRVRLGESP